MKMEDPKPDFSFLVEEPKKLRLAYLHLVVLSRLSDYRNVE
jgi:NADPH2 dehydrogenase